MPQGDFLGDDLCTYVIANYRFPIFLGSSAGNSKTNSPQRRHRSQSQSRSSTSSGLGSGNSRKFLALYPSQMPPVERLAMEISKSPPVINRNANAKKKFYGFTTYDVDNIPRTELWMIYKIVMCTIWSNNKEAFSIYTKNMIAYIFALLVLNFCFDSETAKNIEIGKRLRDLSTHFSVLLKKSCSVLIRTYFKKLRTCNFVGVASARPVTIASEIFWKLFLILWSRKYEIHPFLRKNLIRFLSGKTLSQLQSKFLLP